jgi:hypothetical protein
MLNNKRYRYMSKTASTALLSNGSAANRQQAWVNKFLAGRSKDKLDTVYNL